MKSENTIELNGHLYHAVTGKMLGDTKQAPQQRSGKNIDGFFRARTSVSVRPAAPKQPTAVISDIQPIAHAAQSQKSTVVERHAARSSANHAKAHQPQVSQRTQNTVEAPAKIQTTDHSKAAHATANHTKAHKQQSSATLMRTAVKRPEPSIRQRANVQGALVHTVPGLIELKHPAAAIDTDRLVRAHNVETSPLVAHHGKEVPQTAVLPSIVPLHVQPVPVKPEGDVPPVAPAPQPGNGPDIKPSSKPQEDIFNHALANAANFLDVKDHRNHFRKQSQRHVASMAAGMLALLLITIFAVYQNSPGLQIKVASIQAGVATSAPNFKAAGFAYKGVHAGNGKLTVGFSNGNGNYQLTKQPTSWSNSDMISAVSSVDASGRPNYTSVRAGNTTIYRFNNTSATWVSGGTWYSISGNSALTNTQIKQLVENV